MAEINLRAYVSEIEDLVEHNQLEEAVAHCRHILTIYSKHVDSYRLLGKALLEQGRHSDAADIFQRVHSVAPDDFVAHVGMAIIREDETNLDGAIWHMERAFEVQSSNPVIQEELRRLHGRRDGLEPAKIQYTRGALARTYNRGGLYSQAIAELQAGLTQEPDRLDLKVLLAEALWRDNQRPEAAETCTGVLEKLPFCRQANRIMADILQASGQADQAKFFRTRVEAVDPYEAYVQLPADGDDALSVSDHAVRVPKFQWSPEGEGERVAAGPEWMSALGISLEQPEAANEVPDWLAEPVEVTPAATAEAPTDWLAGLEAAAPAQVSEPVDMGWLRALRAEAEQVEAGVPDRGAAPEAAEPPPAPPDDASLQAPEWLRELESIEPSAKQDSRPPGEPLPDWLRPEEATPGEESASTFEADTGLPDWMRPEAAAEEYAAQPAEPAARLPDWMRVSDLEPGGGREETGPTTRAEADEGAEWYQPAATGMSGPDSVPGWLAGAQPGGEIEAGPPEGRDEEAAEVPEQTPSSAQVPDWLKESLAIAATDETPDEETPPEEESPAEAIARAELPDWIQALAPEPGEAAAEQAPAADLPPHLQAQQPGASDTIAGWLQSQMPQPAAPGPAEAAPEDVPEWLKEALSSETASTPESQQLSDLAAQEQPRGQEAEQPDRAIPLFGDTGPLAEVAAPSPDPFEAPAPPPEPESRSRPEFDQFEAKPGEPAEPKLGVEDGTMAWLESLAAKHGVKDEEPGAEVEPQAQPKDMPDWLRTALAKRTGDEQEADDLELPAPAEPSAEGAPDWLKPPEESPQPEPAAEIPDWLSPPPEVQPEMPSALSPDLTEDGALAWLEALARQHGGEAPEAQRLPDWMAEAPGGPAAAGLVPPGQEAGAPSEAEEATSAALGGSEDEALAWLEALASKHGVTSEAGEGPEAVPPEQEQAPVEAPPPDALPAWLMKTKLLKSVPEPEAESLQPTPTSEEEEVDLLAAAAEIERAEPEPAPAEMKTEEPESIPHWPKSTKPLASTPEAEAESPAEASAEELPEAPAAEVLLGETPEALVEPEKLAAASLPASEGAEDEALAWLEALAAKHGAKDEELVMPAEARSEEMPSWLREQAPAEPEPVSPPTEAPAEPAPAAGAEAEEVPAWLRDAMAAQAAEEAPEPLGLEPPQTAPAEPLPDWLAQAEAPAETEWQPAEAAPAVPGPPAEPESWPAEFWPPAAEAEARPMQIPPPPAEAVRAELTPPPAAEPKPKSTRPPRRRRRPAEPPETRLANARTWLGAGRPDEALSAYESLIRSNQSLDAVVADLEAASKRSPDRRLLRTLGDAYMRQDRLQLALDTYRLALSEA